MAFATRPAPVHDGMAKRHDDPDQTRAWQSTARMRPTPFLRRRRVFVILIILAVAFLFVKNIPTDVPSVGRRIDSRTGQSQGRPFPFYAPSSPKSNQGKASKPGEVYDGPAKFYNLAPSLRPHLNANVDGKDAVLFLLYDLRSAGSLLSTACSMARYKRSIVHIGLVTMSDHSVENIMAVNGVMLEDCPVYWHDARPDHNAQSSPARMATIIKSALSHMHASLRPAVVLIDQNQANNHQLKAAMQSRLDVLRVPLVVLPNEAGTSLDWINSLDGRALALLHQTQIDITIMPYKQSAGSLIRLLESIRSAHYGGLPLPRVTVEIPQNIDPFALRYLETFRWPTDSPTGPSKLVLRRYLDTNTLTPAIAAVRTLESFYPPAYPMSHVLILSPDVELAPNYLHYLYFTTLEYKYSRNSLKITNSFMGISLDLPDTLLDDKSPFAASTLPASRPLLLHKAPTSTAALYFGDKWVELQNYLTLRLKHDPTLAKSPPNTPEMSPNHPSWLRQTAELMQAQNYYMLYPRFAADSPNCLVTRHSEVHQHPEELWKQPASPAANEIPSLDDSTVLSAEDETSPIHAHMSHEQTQEVISLTRLLGLGAYDSPPADADLPLLSATGHLVSGDGSDDTTQVYADQLSLAVGGCASLDARDAKKARTIEYLFCNTK